MKNIFIIALLFCSTVLFTSCEEKIELELPEGEKMLVVEGWLTNESIPHFVKLSYTSGYFNSEASPVATGATVYTNDNTGATLSWVEDPENPGFYFCEGIGETDKTYELHITLADGSVVQSIPEKLVAVPPISNLYWEELPEEDLSTEDIEEGKRYEIKINTFETPGIGDFYRWLEFVNGEYQDEPFDIYTASDEMADGSPIIGLNVTYERYVENDTIMLVQQRISESAYEFLVTLQSQTAFVGSPFDGPPAPIEGNLYYVDQPTKNVLGFFGVAGSTRDSVIIGN